MLNLLLTQPILLAIGALFGGLGFALVWPSTQIQGLRTFILNVSLVARFLGRRAALSFDKSRLGFQFFWRLDLLAQYNLSLTLGVDGISLVFILLTLFTFPTCFLASWGVTKQTKQFYCYLLARELLLVLTFATLDLFYFYVFFESLLIPRFIIIGVWGARERKIKAAYYFFLYTLFGSLVRLFGVLYLYFIAGSTNYRVILNTALTLEEQQIIWSCFFLAFAVKRPLFPFHIWLPEAHVEAPTVGSRLLASLRLKLGGYGFLRFSLSRLSLGSSYFAPRVSRCALLGVVYGSLSTRRQIDLKRIIAYSSVAHRNLVRLGLFSNTQVGIEGAIYLRVGHGVVSSALFFCVGVLYDRYHSRLLRYYGGLTTVRPLFSTSLFLFTLANRSFPGTSNFLGEILLFAGIFANNSLVLVFATAGIVFSSVYSTLLFNRVTRGTLKTTYISRFKDLDYREFLILVVLAVARVILGLTSSTLEYIDLPVKSLVQENFPPIFCLQLGGAQERIKLSWAFCLAQLINMGIYFSKTLFAFSPRGAGFVKNSEVRWIARAVPGINSFFDTKERNILWQALESCTWNEEITWRYSNYALRLLARGVFLTLLVAQKTYARYGYLSAGLVSRAAFRVLVLPAYALCCHGITTLTLIKIQSAQFTHLLAREPVLSANPTLISVENIGLFFDFEGFDVLQEKVKTLVDLVYTLAAIHFILFLLCAFYYIVQKRNGKKFFLFLFGTSSTLLEPFQTIATATRNKLTESQDYVRIFLLLGVSVFAIFTLIGLIDYLEDLIRWRRFGVTNPLILHLIQRLWEWLQLLRRLIGNRYVELLLEIWLKILQYQIFFNFGRIWMRFWPTLWAWLKPRLRKLLGLPPEPDKKQKTGQPPL